MAKTGAGGHPALMIQGILVDERLWMSKTAEGSDRYITCFEINLEAKNEARDKSSLVTLPTLHHPSSRNSDVAEVNGNEGDES